MIQGLFSRGLANHIDDKLWQGEFPHSDEWGRLSTKGFGAVVLCAQELQPRDEFDFFPGVELILAPMDDAVLTDEEVAAATFAARRALAYLHRGQRVLVTCAAGRNRSGLVSALVLMMRRGMTGEEAVRRVQSRRKDALTNPSFAAYLRGLPPSPRG
jgi:hypothetical protein